MNFQTNSGPKVALTGCWKVKRHRHSEQTHSGTPRSAALKKMLTWLMIWF